MTCSALVYWGCMTKAETKTEILERTEDLPDAHKLQAQFALAAFATLKAKNVTYVSVPITSGPRLYDFIDRRGYKTVEEAKSHPGKFFKEVVEPNLEQGVEGSHYWVEKLHGTVIAPAEFEGRLRRQWGHIDWGQDDFMGMWVPLIDEKVTNMVMLNGWEFSNGSGEEYLQAVLMQMGRRPRSDITIQDGEEGSPIKLDEGIGLMANAFKNVLSRGIKPKNMAETLGLLIEAERRFNIEQTTGHLIEPAASSPDAHDAGKTKPAVPAYDHEKVAAIAKEIVPLLDEHFPHVMEKLKATSSYDFSPINAVFRPVKKPETAAVVPFPAFRPKAKAAQATP